MPQLFYDSIQNDGVRIQYYRTGGEKYPLVFLHDVGENGLCWGRLVLLLEPEFDVIMVDARGHGLSGTPENGYKIDRHVEDVSGVIQKTGVHKPVVIGHVMGALTAAALGKKFPELVSGLVLIDPPWYALSPEAAKEYNQRLSNKLRQQVSVLQEKPLEEIIQAGKELHPSWMNEDLFQWAKAKQQMRLEAADYMLESQEPWEKILSQLSASILLLTADVSSGGNVTHSVAETARKLSNKIQIVNIPESGHNIHRDQPSLFWDALYRFLKNHHWPGIKGRKRFSLWPFTR
ncbi:MAG: alpha/beta hydrolase [Anaerolineae bacterium]|nr:alpha/beta hydrolase [Anaerolineae bacterium]